MTNLKATVSPFIISHSLILVVCSMIGLFGFYFQYGIFQVTALIPASIGISLLLILALPVRREWMRFMVLLLVVFVFGIILIRMSIKFLPQDFQPLRKRIYFPVMAISSIATFFAMILRVRKNK